MQTKMLIDKYKFQIGNQFLKHIQYIDHFQVPVNYVIDITREVSRQQVVQRLRDHLNMNECSRLFAITLNRDKLVKISLENEFIDHGIKPHAFAVAIYIAAA